MDSTRKKGHCHSNYISDTESEAESSGEEMPQRKKSRGSNDRKDCHHRDDDKKGCHHRDDDRKGRRHKEKSKRHQHKKGTVTVLVEAVRGGEIGGA